MEGIHAWKYSRKYKDHAEEYKDGDIDPTDSFDVIEIECCVAEAPVGP